mmetsp:Transcript_37494/g.94200  ORF Transcript_37494/g.94200 Transcript_37494/m.94200 type:complete len:206 (-) Transcript_37494:472-1089(-)
MNLGLDIVVKYICGPGRIDDGRVVRRPVHIDNGPPDGILRKTFYGGPLGRARVVNVHALPRSGCKHGPLPGVFTVKPGRLEAFCNVEAALGGKEGVGKTGKDPARARWVQPQLALREEVWVGGGLADMRLDGQDDVLLGLFNKGLRRSLNRNIRVRQDFRIHMKEAVRKRHFGARVSGCAFVLYMRCSFAPPCSRLDRSLAGWRI